MAYVEVHNLTKVFGTARAVDNISFTVPAGKLLTLLGPSGCGKTTTLRSIGGLERPDDGDIVVDGDYITSASRKIFRPPEARGLGMVFQSYAIWPHMSVFDNVAFPLRMRRVPEKEKRKRVLEVLDLVGLSGFDERNATELSGGQQQRVALARAIVGHPRLLLFDEPLSNLDAKLRERMRYELVRLQREVGITSIYVTHDQQEAMAISDELIVMNHGRIEQRGDAQSIYFNPVNRFVADFFGAANFFDAELVDGPDASGHGKVRILNGAETIIDCRVSQNAVRTKRVVLTVRPEAVSILSDRPPAEKNVLEARLSSAQFLGDHYDARLEVAGKETRAKLDLRSSATVGDRLYVQLAPDRCIAIPED